MLMSVEVGALVVEGDQTYYALTSEQRDRHPGAKLGEHLRLLIKDVDIILDEAGMRVQVVHDNRFSLLAQLSWRGVLHQELEHALRLRRKRPSIREQQLVAITHHTIDRVLGKKEGC